MRIIILLDNRVCHVNPFQLVCFPSSGSDHFNFRKINYHFFSTVFVSSVSKLPLFFPPTHPFFFKDSDFFIKYPSYGCEASSFFPFNVLTRWFSRRCSTSSSFAIPFSYPVDSSQVLLIIPFSSFQCLLIPVHLIIILLLAICYSGVLKISRRFVFPLCIRSSSFEIGISFKSFNSTGATSLLNLFNGVLLSGP